ncbi:hypothetical protein [Ferruginibacter sp. HRS2-29]|uniref:hypothetical protein n=1 Tax=Ferruginibacter sp. HRS2-29 TaxID=2487334 RepID=UPI0020CF4278|nr:hypothetical protein [Ferruginibacter sp. HRS2-29]MCP9752049.1 hypothetical protein [Ferruginibacter sp. HRS2-29]
MIKMIKVSLVIAALLFCSAACFAQAKLEGSWKPAKVEIGNLMYIDVDKDSVFFSDAFMKELDKDGKMDSAAKAGTVDVLKATLGSAFQKITINIDKNGGIYEGEKKENIGQYDATKNLITFTDKDTKKSITGPVEIKDGLLKVIMPSDEEQLVIWCRKAN